MCPYMDKKKNPAVGSGWFPWVYVESISHQPMKKEGSER